MPWPAAAAVVALRRARAPRHACRTVYHSHVAPRGGVRLHPLRPFVLQLWNETLLSFPPWPAAGVLPATRAAEHGRPAVSFWTASPPEREDVRAAPCDPSPKRRKQRRGCRQDAPRPSE